MVTNYFVAVKQYNEISMTNRRGGESLTGDSSQTHTHNFPQIMTVLK